MDILNTTLEERIAKYAEMAGSSAKTQRGQLRAIVRRCDKFRLIKRVIIRGDFMGTQLDAYTRKQTRADYYTGKRSSRLTLICHNLQLYNVRELESIADFLRAQKDHKFRKNLLARINRQLKQLISPPQSLTLADITRYAESETERRETYLKTHAFYKLLGGRKKHTLLTTEATCRAHFLRMSEELAKEHGVKLSRKGKDWEVIPTLKNSYLDYQAPETTWKNWRPVEYTRAVYDNYVRSFAHIKDTKTLLIAVHNSEYERIAPDGFTWKFDGLGVKLVRESDGEEYHPSLSELLYEPVDLALNNAHAKRLEREKRYTLADKKAAELLEELRSSDAYVCLKDSLESGNCRQGTIEWARQRGLEKDKHYPVKLVLKQESIEKDHRLKQALIEAHMRHQREVAQGYSVLADHV